MKRTYLSGFFVLILIAFMLAACGSSGGGGDGDGNGGIPPTTTVSGTVLDINNNAVEGAEVTIMSDPVTVMTDADGIFSAVVEVGDHEIVIKKGSEEIYFGNFTCYEDKHMSMGNITTDYDPGVVYGLTLPLYDDFSSSDIDQTKWNGFRFVREIQNGSIIFEQFNHSSNQTNYLWIANPETVSSISAEVTVTGYDASGARTEARIRGGFYNDGSSGASSGSSIGDIFAIVRLRNGEVQYNVARCIDDGCYASDNMDSGVIGAYNLGEKHEIGIEWDETDTRFIFSFDNSLTEVDTSILNAPVISSTPNRPFMQIGTRINASSGEYGSITSAFDNVHVNGTLYDDFSQSSIDFSKWTGGERKRKIESGKLILTRREESSGSYGLDFSNPETINAMYADVTVTDYEDTGGYTRARLQGSYYNATPGSTSVTGDIWADIRIDDNTAYYLVFKVLDDEWNEEYISGTSDDPRVSIGTVSMNETHGLFIQWDGSKFTFQLDDDPVHTFDPVAAGYPVINTYPNNPVKKLNVRTSSSSDQPSKITASFDNVRAGSSVGSTVVGTWDLTRDGDGNAVPSGMVTLIMTNTTFDATSQNCQTTGTYIISGTSMTLTIGTAAGNGCDTNPGDIQVFQFTANSTNLALASDDGTMIWKKNGSGDGDNNDNVVWRINKWEVDYDNNGYITWVMTVLYDANGNITKMEEDNNNDGIVDQVEIPTYDANGNVVKYEQDANDDGILEILTYTYDTNGNMIKMDGDGDRDGNIDYVKTVLYDANGNITKMEEDFGNDGSIENVQTHTFDANGNLTKIEEDNGNDGTINDVYTFTYDNDGKVIKMEEDNGNDGTINDVDTVTYDNDGNVIKVEEDDPYDGIVDQVRYFTWEKGQCNVAGINGIMPANMRVLGLMCH